MRSLFLHVFHVALICKLDSIFADKCDRINTTILPSCGNVGYNFTARFSSVVQQTYQEYISSEVSLLVDRFNHCSQYSQLFVCSRYVPKCDEALVGPVLPCREVCHQFVNDCAEDLKESGLHGTYLAYCGLLSSQEQNSTNCLKPQGFVQTVNITKETRLPSCERVIEPACLDNNLSVLENATKIRLQSSLQSLASVLNSGCSPNLQKFSCFVQTAPCATSNGSTLFICQSLCEEVGTRCDDQFQRHNIVFPRCIPNYPESIAGNGLCRLSQWPVPWPSPSRDGNTLKRLECHCDDCGNGSTCITDGSCFMQHSSDAKGTTLFIRTCLDKGPQRNFICDPSISNKQDILCCEKDFCNGNLSVPTSPPNTVIKKTKEPTIRSEKTITDKSTDLEEESKPGRSNDDGASNKKEKSLPGSLVAVAVVASVSFGILVIALLVYLVQKRRRKNANAKPTLPNFIDSSNISACGTSVTIGERNKAFERDIFKNESALF